MTRANWVVMLPPSPTIACVKLPELRTKVESPSPNVASSMVTPAQAESCNTCWLYGRPRRISTRNVSRLELDSVLSPDNSQNRWLNSCAVSLVLINFSIRSVARPLKGALLLTDGDVE